MKIFSLRNSPPIENYYFYVPDNLIIGEWCNICNDLLQEAAWKVLDEFKKDNKYVSWQDVVNTQVILLSERFEFVQPTAECENLDFLGLGIAGMAILDYNKKFDIMIW